LTMVESLDQNLNVQIAVALGPQDALAHIRENRIDVIFIEPLERVAIDWSPPLGGGDPGTT
jgi:hypothetical protein